MQKVKIMKPSWVHNVFKESSKEDVLATSKIFDRYKGGEDSMTRVSWIEDSMKNGYALPMEQYRLFDKAPHSESSLEKSDEKLLLMILDQLVSSGKVVYPITIDPQMTVFILKNGFL